MSDSSEQPIVWKSRVHLVDEVVEMLRRWIYSGKLKPGEPLRQETLAEQLQISRTPLREALRVLERDGLVAADGGRGVRVISIDFDVLFAAYEVREFFDALAARLSAERATPADLERLHAAIAQQRAASEPPWSPAQYTAANVAFHLAVVAAARNEFLDNYIPVVHITSEIFTPVALMDDKRVASAIEEHEQLLNAICSGDGAQAELLARRHIATTRSRLQQRRDRDR